MIRRIASRFGTGSEPGWPRHTGQTFVLGSRAERDAAPAEHLRPGVELHVAFEPDHGFVLGHDGSSLPDVSRGRPLRSGARRHGVRSDSPTYLADDPMARAPRPRRSGRCWAPSTSSGARPTWGSRRSTSRCPTLLGRGHPVPVRRNACCSRSPRLRTGERTTRRQWTSGRRSSGMFLLLGGNALVAVSENMGTPTGIVSLIIALIPLWLALLRPGRVPRSAPLGWRVVVGLVGGLHGRRAAGGRRSAGHACRSAACSSRSRASCAGPPARSTRGRRRCPKAPLLGSGDAAAGRAAA